RDLRRRACRRRRSEGELRRSDMTMPTTDQKSPIETPRSDAGNWAKPVRTLTTKDVPAGATDLNVTGRRLYGVSTGFGRLWQKSFSVRLEGAAVTPPEG